MTCKDCIHNDACDYWVDGYEESLFREDPTIDEACPNFTDKSKFIELPCKAGDKYYTIYTYCTKGGYYDKPSPRLNHECEWCDCKCDKYYQIKEYTFGSKGQIFNMLKYFGRVYYLTKEEAEKALREKLK